MKILNSWLTLGWLVLVAQGVDGEDFTLHAFSRQQLSDVYYSEGANAADLNGDGVVDVVYGPYWFEGPTFETKHEIYPPVAQNRDRYADNFFSWPYDFDNDGWNDLFVVGFPGTPAYVYQNPGSANSDQHWTKHQVFDWVSNESPQLVNVVGDEQPELVCTRDGFFGFATIDWSHPLDPWEFHPISEKVAATKFGHGLGVGDVNGDGLQDVLHANGWFEQPSDNALTSRWRAHEVSFSEGYGGAEMYAYDVDGDGDNDIITSHNAHDFGLGWYEQAAKNDRGEIQFQHHLIMGEHPSENRYGIVFSEPHSVALADMDGDGLKDIVTGKTYWSHHRKSPLWDAGAVVYWFKLVRDGEKIDWLPFQIDQESGIGRQISVVDVNRDGLPDIVVGGMIGAHVLTHSVKTVSETDYLAAQPVIYSGPKQPSIDGAEPLRGDKPKLDAAGHLPDAIEAESMKGSVTAGQLRSQNMSAFKGDRWSQNAQLFWTGAKPSDTLTLPLPAFSGSVTVNVVLTTAPDYGIVQLLLDDQPIGPPLDLYSREVTTTGLLSFANVQVTGTSHQLHVQMLGANSKAKKAYMFGMDCLQIQLADGTFVSVPPADER